MATGVTALGMLVRDRHTGRLNAKDYQRLYIQDQQEDINALRRDLSQLWAWAVKAVRQAAAGGVELDPLPTQVPESQREEQTKGQKG